jgi:hypothetical protein
MDPTETALPFEDQDDRKGVCSPSSSGVRPTTLMTAVLCIADVFDHYRTKFKKPNGSSVQWQSVTTQKVQCSLIDL